MCLLLSLADIVYAVVYSLMLLNTDLHIASGHQRMSRSAFCKNTLSTLCGHIDSVDVDVFGGVDAWKADMDIRLKVECNKGDVDTKMYRVIHPEE